MTSTGSREIERLVCQLSTLSPSTTAKFGGFTVNNSTTSRLGHLKSECPKRRNKPSAPAAEGSVKAVWLSKRVSTTHNDAERVAQCNERTHASANVARVNSTKSLPAPIVPEVERGGFLLYGNPSTKQGSAVRLQRVYRA